MHGTSIALIGHLTRENMGKDPPPLDMDMQDDSFIELPDDYAVVAYVEDTVGDIFLQPTQVMNKMLDNTQCGVCITEQVWLSHVLVINSKRSMMESGNWMRYKSPTLGSFQANRWMKSDPMLSLAFPVFTEEKSDTLSMQKHAMLVVKKAITFVNPGQTPVLEGDCPLYSRQKRCQFLFPEEVGER